MADERSGMSSGQVMVALIGAAAVIGSALIANSDRLFGSRAEADRPPAPMPGPAPANSLVDGAVPESAPAQTETQTPARYEIAAQPVPAAISMAGAWRGADGQVWEFTQDGDRYISERAEGIERIRMEAQVSGQAVRILVDYFQQSTGDLGLRIMNCEGQFTGGGQQIQMSCLNPQTNVTSRPTWSRV